MPREQRRAAIIEATLPLIHEVGTAVTTRQVAEAAGVAEGTIFRVFDSLQELIDATIDQIKRSFDQEHGGLRRAPKFPSHVPLRLLLRHHQRTGDAD